MIGRLGSLLLAGLAGAGTPQAIEGLRMRIESAAADGLTEAELDALSTEAFAWPRRRSRARRSGTP